MTEQNLTAVLERLERVEKTLYNDQRSEPSPVNTERETYRARVESIEERDSYNYCTDQD
jgi:hypothetical protein